MKPIPFTLAALTAILMSGAALAQTELCITHSMTGGGNKVALDAIMADFEAAYPDIKVKQIVFDDDLYSDTGLITQLKSNEVPDIYFQWAGFPVQRDAEAGYAMDLTEALASDGWGDTFSPSLWTEGAGTMADGKPYLVPGSIDLTNTIWYNTAIFQDNGLTAPKTWTEFTDLIKVLVAAGETPIVERNN